MMRRRGPGLVGTMAGGFAATAWQKVERVISGGAGLQFKGTGFYLTDYARKGGEKGSSDAGEKKESSASRGML